MAFKEYQEALRLNPQFTPAATAAGWLRFEKGRLDEALDLFSVALKVNPKDADATFGVGRVYGRKG